MSTALSRNWGCLPIILLITSVTGLTGCRSWWKSDAEVNVAVLETKLTAEREARIKEDAVRAAKAKADAERTGTAAAYVVAASEATTHLPDIEVNKLPKAAIQSDLNVATKSLDAPPAEKLAEARLATNLILQGKLAEANAMFDKINARVIEAERVSAAAAALVANASAEVTRVRAETDAQVIKTKADSAASLAAKDAELDRKLKEKDAAQALKDKEKDAEIARAKANGPLIAQMARSEDLAWGARMTGIGAVAAGVVFVFLKTPLIATLAGMLAGTSGALLTFSIGIMDDSVRPLAYGLTGLTVVASVGGVIYSITHANKKKVEASERAESAHTFDEMIPSLAESFKTLAPEAQTVIIDMVAKGMGNTAKGFLSQRLLSLGYAVPEAWAPLSTKTAPKPTPES